MYGEYHFEHLMFRWVRPLKPALIAACAAEFAGRFMLNVLLSGEAPFYRS